MNDRILMRLLRFARNDEYGVFQRVQRLQADSASFIGSRVMKLNRKEFDRAVQHAYHRIPTEIRERMGNVVLTVQRRPTEEMLASLGYPPDEPLLGLYEGASLLEHSFFETPPLLPDTIYIFQEPLEEMCDSLPELEREIEITVVHEVAHFLGIGEERLEELGYG